MLALRVNETEHSLENSFVVYIFALGEKRNPRYHKRTLFLDSLHSLLTDKRRIKRIYFFSVLFYF